MSRPSAGATRKNEHRRSFSTWTREVPVPRAGRSVPPVEPTAAFSRYATAPGFTPNLLTDSQGDATMAQSVRPSPTSSRRIPIIRWTGAGGSSPLT